MTERSSSSEDPSKEASHDEQTRLWSDLPTRTEPDNQSSTENDPKQEERTRQIDASQRKTTQRPTTRSGTSSSTTPPRSASDEELELPGSLQERYQLVSVLGKGGFANVYLAFDKVLDQQVAIKVLKLGRASQSDRKRFLFEARVGARLRHPNIATIFDIVQTPDGLQMIMEYYPNGTLAELLKKQGKLRPLHAIEITRQVAQALSFAHQREFVHRDIKPANIFLGDDGHAILGDFGIAAHQQVSEHTQTGVVIGTPMYMAPEQGRDSHDVDPRTDIYSLGLTLYHMLTGEPPRVLDLEQVPTSFRPLIKHATQPDRSRRLVSAQQMAASLDQIREEIVKGVKLASLPNPLVPSAAEVDPIDLSDPPLHDSAPTPLPPEIAEAKQELEQASTDTRRASQAESQETMTAVGQKSRSGLQKKLIFFGIPALIVVAALAWLASSKSDTPSSTVLESPGTPVASPASGEAEALRFALPPVDDNNAGNDANHAATPPVIITTPEPSPTPSETPETTEPTPAPSESVLAPQGTAPPESDTSATPQPTAPPAPGLPAALTIPMDKRLEAASEDSRRVRQAIDLLKKNHEEFNTRIFIQSNLASLETESKESPEAPLPDLLRALIYYRSAVLSKGDAAREKEAGRLTREALAVYFKKTLATLNPHQPPPPPEILLDIRAVGTYLKWPDDLTSGLRPYVQQAREDAGIGPGNKRQHLPPARLNGRPPVRQQR